MTGLAQAIPAVDLARREPAWLLAGVSLALLASGIAPEADRLTWFLETFPVMIGAPVLLATHRGFPLTPLAYRLLALHALVLIVGGYYSYAENPLFNWLRDVLLLDRNYYDRVGHVFQGFVPAILAREVLLRRSPLPRGKWLFFLVCCICLALSAGYELLEWWVAVASGEAAVAFLATQGDVWDTQWDMFLALLGALAAQLSLTRIHDRQLLRLG